MVEEAQNRGRMLALILGSTAVLLGVAGVLWDLFQGEGFSAGPLVAVTAGLVAIASVRRRRSAS